MGEDGTAPMRGRAAADADEAYLENHAAIITPIVYPIAGGPERAGGRTARRRRRMYGPEAHLNPRAALERPRPVPPQRRPSASLLLLAVTAALSAGELGAAPPPVLKTLPGPPRLLVLADDVARAKTLADTDPTARKYREGLRFDGEKILGEPTVEYVPKGPRLLDQSRLCLRRITMLAGLYRLDGDRRWVERAKRELFAAAFPDWNPSHFLDTAEMTHAFAVGYDWLYDALSNEDRATIRRAIVEKGLTAGKKQYEKPASWVTAHHNWNQVCNGGLTLGALAVADEEPEIAAFIIASALKSLPRAMTSFGPDGGWNEGPGYWNCTVVYTVPLIAGLETALGSEFGLAEYPGFDRTGLFRLYFVGPTRRPFNYADGGDGKMGGLAHMYWMARRFHQPVYSGLGGGGATLTRNGKTIQALVVEPANATLAVESATPPPPQNQNAGIHKLVVRLPEKVAKTRVAVLLTTRKTDHDAAKTGRVLAPLPDWDRTIHVAR